MNSFTSRTGTRVAVSATVLSFVCTYFFPYGYPWPSLAWAGLACVAAVWVARSSLRPIPMMSDIIRNVEAETPRAGAPGPGVVSSRAVL